MTIEEALVERLIDAGTLADARIYPNVIPQDITAPSLAYQRITGPRLLAHDGPTGLAMPLIQITCQGRTYAEAKELANQVRIALDGFRGVVGSVKIEEGKISNEQDGYNLSSGYQTVRLDVKFVHQE